jgi:4-hydroxy-tetrahydrodipicolinate synthase
MRNGGTGVISATANVNAAAIDELYATSDPLRQPRTLSGLEHPVGKLAASPTEFEKQQADLNVVRQVFSSRKFPSMIAALKQAIAIYTNDPAWRTVRPPLVELTSDQAKTLDAELKAFGFTMSGH